LNLKNHELEEGDWDRESLWDGLETKHCLTTLQLNMNDPYMVFEAENGSENEKERPFFLCSDDGMYSRILQLNSTLCHRRGGWQEIKEIKESYWQGMLLSLVIRFALTNK
jgi:hypothetical protein